MSAPQVVSIAPDEFTADLARARLRAAGIDSIVSGDDPFGPTDPAGCVLLVAPSDIDEARAIVETVGPPTTYRRRPKIRALTWLLIGVVVGIPVVVQIIRLLG